MEDFFTYTFLQRAFLLAFFSGTLCGLMGVFVALWRISLVGMCISHAAFAGTLGGLWLGFSPLLGGLGASIAAAGFAGALAERPGFSLDTAMGIIFSVVMSLAMLALGMLPGARTEGLGLIWGNLLTATWTDISCMVVVTLFVVLFICALFKEIQAILCHKRAAEACGIPIRPIYYSTLILMGLVVAFSLKAVGGLLIYSLIITPAATALQLTYSLRNMFVYAALFGALASCLGLYISYFLDIPTGASIVMVASSMLMISMLLSKKQKMQ